jgi:TetR/AcrR family transcriptional regulator of autoinduction and epiphytic fitness
MPELAALPREATADGRRLRREQNREMAIDALLALLADGNCQPSTAAVAARAGLSPRSLFRYFEDTDDLYLAAATRQIVLALPLLELDVRPDFPAVVKAAAVVRARGRLFETIGPGGRALRASAYRNEVLAAELDRYRAFFRGQLSEVFAPELTGDGAVMGPALNVLCSFESYELLRYGEGLSRRQAEAALTAAVRALLGCAGMRPEARS